MACIYLIRYVALVLDNTVGRCTQHITSEAGFIRIVTNVAQVVRNPLEFLCLDKPQSIIMIECLQGIQYVTYVFETRSHAEHDSKRNGTNVEHVMNQLFESLYRSKSWSTRIIECKRVFPRVHYVSASILVPTVLNRNMVLKETEGIPLKKCSVVSCLRTWSYAPHSIAKKFQTKRIIGQVVPPIHSNSLFW